MGLSMCSPPVASFSVRDSNGIDLIKVSTNDKNLSHRTVPGPTGQCQVPQDGARCHRTVPGATGRCQVPQDGAQVPGTRHIHNVIYIHVYLFGFSGLRSSYLVWPHRAHGHIEPPHEGILEMLGLSEGNAFNLGFFSTLV